MIKINLRRVKFEKIKLNQNIIHKNKIVYIKLNKLKQINEYTKQIKRLRKIIE